MPDPLPILGALRGTPSLVIVCALLFLEEAGLPLPFAPGEAVLIGAGLLIASGAEPFWLVIPASYAAALAGVLVGFTWSRAIGPQRLRGLAARLGADAAFDRVSGRLRDAGISGIAVSRLIPGLRIYTTLVAGAAGMEARVFALAVVPAVAVWVLLFIGLGVFVGIPAQHLLGRFENLALKAAIVVVLLVIGYLVLRRIPAPRRVGWRRARGPVPPWRILSAAAIDLMVVAFVMLVLGVLTGLAVGSLDNVVSTIFLVGIFFLVYLAVARRSVGITVGEALFRVRYP